MKLRPFRRSPGGGVRRRDESPAVRLVAVSRRRSGAWCAESDAAAVEEPLEIRIDGEPFAVIMRTPGADRDLAAGFLVSERVIARADDLKDMVSACGEPGQSAGCNRIEVTLAHGGGRRVARRIVTSSSCGLCGRQTLASLAVDAPALEGGPVIAMDVLATLPAELGRHQAGFAATGGLHAAGLFDAGGRLETMAEDVGRHNAVDKVIGRRLLAGDWPLAASVLLVSGRASFEIVQKAFLAGVPVVGAVSAPSSLAIDLADTAGISLVAFVRGGAGNVYTHPHRILP